MSVEVRYYCPHCGAVATLERDPYMADKSVTPYPLEGWTYVSPSEDYEDDAVDGVRFVCGESDVEWDTNGPTSDGDDTNAGNDGIGGTGCGEPFYLNFVRYEQGEEVEREPESKHVTLAPKNQPSGPRGPQGPGGPSL